MHRGAAAFLDEAPKRLDVIMVDAAPGNPQPFAFSVFHQIQRDVRVLKLFVGFHRFQIGTAENKSVRAERIGKRIFRQHPVFNVAVARNQFRICAHQPGHRVADVQQMRDVGAERSHFWRRQIITFDAERLRIFLERGNCQSNVIHVSDFVVRVHEDDEFASSMAQREAFAFFHVFAVIVENHCAEFFGDVARAVGGMRVGEDNFYFFARKILPRNGREAIFQNGLGIERRHDEADARKIF